MNPIERQAYLSAFFFNPHFHIIKYIKNIHEGKRDFRF